MMTNQTNNYKIYKSISKLRKEFIDKTRGTGYVFEIDHKFCEQILSDLNALVDLNSYLDNSIRNNTDNDKSSYNDISSLKGYDAYNFLISKFHLIIEEQEKKTFHEDCIMKDAMNLKKGDILKIRATSGITGPPYFKNDYAEVMNVEISDNDAMAKIVVYSIAYNQNRIFDNILLNKKLHILFLK